MAPSAGRNTTRAAEPVAFAGCGGLLIERHAVVIPDAPLFPGHSTTWQDGRPLDPEAVARAKSALDQPTWWAGALRSARETVPCPA